MSRPSDSLPVVDSARSRSRAIRLVAIDLDGTLLDDAKEIGRETAEALRGLPERGVKVVLASARPPRSVRGFYQALGLDTLQINYNGALIWDEPQRRVVFHRPLAGALVREMIDAARERYARVLVTCEILDQWYTDRHDLSFTTETGRLFKPDVVAPLEHFCDREITKLLLLGEPLVIAALEPHLMVRFSDRAAFVRTDVDLLQIMEKSVSKAAALKWVAEHYGVEMEEVMAIGDAPNDVGMLRAAGMAVAMGNGHPVVKEAADWIAPSNNFHGVLAGALRQFGLWS